MVTIDQLKETFAVVDVSPYGSCFVIPARMFGAAWEADLKQQGCKIFAGVSEGRSAFYVKLPNARSATTEEKVVYTPSSKERQRPSGRSWTTEETQHLIQLAEQYQDLSLKNLIAHVAKELPGRTENAVKMRIDRLRRKGDLPFLPTRQYRSKQRGRPFGDYYTDEEDARIIELAQQFKHLTFAKIIPKIAEQLPGRTGRSVEKRIDRLREQGQLPFLPPKREWRRRTPPPAEPAAPPPNQDDAHQRSATTTTIDDQEKRVKEFLQASAQLYPQFRHASALLLREAAKEMERNSTDE